MAKARRKTLAGVQYEVKCCKFTEQLSIELPNIFTMEVLSCLWRAAASKARKCKRHLKALSCEALQWALETSRE